MGRGKFLARSCLTRYSARLKVVDLERDGLDRLRSARFPVHAVPPSQWPGDVIVGGVSGERSHPLAIHMRYDDDLLVERPARRVQITSSGIEALSKKAPHEGFLLWEHSYSSTLQNFVYNITPERFPERPISGTERFNSQLIDGKRVAQVVHLPSAGPRRFIDAVPFRDGYQMERVAFDEWPPLRLNRIQMTEVEVLILAWGWNDEPLREFATAARPVTDGLLSEIEQAESDAWTKIHQRTQRDQDQ